MREAYNHSWNYELMHECSWSDLGTEMLERLLRDPETTKKRWTYLLILDGGQLIEEQAAVIVGWDRLNDLRS